ncbi:hypothetical protein SAMN05518672_11123 [Chitinophaga sp. CF118]|nr:hypothetical protein SAMN05518672_11123 [Chitinophaga sp. CF118]
MSKMNLKFPDAIILVRRLPFWFYTGGYPALYAGIQAYQ